MSEQKFDFQNIDHLTLEAQGETRMGEPHIAQGQQVEWRKTAVMLEQANAGLAQLNGKLRAELSALKAQQVGQESEPAPKQHPDDAAVDRFAAAMKAKLARSREKGRHGWQNCTAPHLSAMLYDHLYKADPLDVGNFAMMLHQNGQAIELPFEARVRHTAPQPAPAQDVAGLVEALKTIYDEDYQAPHDSTDGEIKESMKRCIFRIRRIVKDALAAHGKQSGEKKS